MASMTIGVTEMMEMIVIELKMRRTIVAKTTELTSVPDYRDTEQPFRKVFII